MHTTEELQWALKTVSYKECRRLLPKQLYAQKPWRGWREDALYHLLFKDHDAASKLVRASKRKDAAKNEIWFCIAVYVSLTMLVFLVVAFFEFKSWFVFAAACFVVAVQCVIDVAPWPSAVRKGWFSALYRLLALVGAFLTFLNSSDRPVVAPALAPASTSDAESTGGGASSLDDRVAEGDLRLLCPSPQ
jgi:hypothetical protein